MRVSYSSDFDLDIQEVPATVARWALEWVEAAKSPDCTLADLTAGAKLLQSDDGNAYSRRRRGHRLIFTVKAEKNAVAFVAIRKREDVYEVAAARISRMH